MIKLSDMSKQAQELINQLAESIDGIVTLDDYEESYIDSICEELEQKGIDIALYFDGETLLCGILEEFEETQNISFDFD